MVAGGVLPIYFCMVKNQQIICHEVLLLYWDNHQVEFGGHPDQFGGQ